MSELKKILILALGGEGGGTLTEWVVQAGIASGWPIQATSIPGVAQRTGGTSYYIECLPRPLRPGEAAPPMCLAPLAGDLDLILSSELLETARALERGMASPAQTHIITSTARSLTTQERIHMADGRFDAPSILSAAQQTSLSLDSLDMSQLAREHGTVVSAVMFGALAASGVLPFSSDVCEQVIAGDSPNSNRTKSSVKGFAAGFDRSKWPLAHVFNALLAPNNIATESQIVAGMTLPSPVAQIALHGHARLIDHQDIAYADFYVSRVKALADLDKAPFEASAEAARTLALWMAYEDVIRVADLKSRRSRFEQIRRDYGAKPHEPVIVRDFLKPGIAEIADILPPALSKHVSQWGQQRLQRTGSATLGEGLMLSTSSITGLLAMRTLAKLRWLRRRSARFISEQALIERWLNALLLALRNQPALALPLAKLPGLLKGYSDTHARGKANFLRILENLLEPALLAGQPVDPELPSKLRAAFKAAQASPDGHALLDLLHLPRPAIREQVIHFAKPTVRAAQ